MILSANREEVGYRRETVLTGLLVGLTDVSKIGPQSPSRLVVHLDISRLHLHHQSSVSLNSMYNGQRTSSPSRTTHSPTAPFRPPFPPTMGSGNGTPPNFPPFPPAGQNGFVRPPFAPNFPPGQQPPAFSPSGYSPGTPLGSASPAGFRPPPGAIPPRPAHPGLGLPPLPAGLPRPPSLGSTGPPPVFKKDVKTTSVFVGSIAPGIADVTLHHLLNVSRGARAHRRMLTSRHADLCTSSRESKGRMESLKRLDSPCLKAQKWSCGVSGV